MFYGDGEPVSELELLLRERIAEVTASVSEDLRKTQLGLSERLNQTYRRLRVAETRPEWRAILSETASQFCGNAAVFLTSDPGVADAPAFATTIESKDVVVTLRDASQLSTEVMQTLSDSSSPRCYLFPILEGDRVAAVLCVEPGSGTFDRNALELLASMASGTLPKIEVPAEAANSLIQISGVVANPQARRNALQAQRFARVRAAEIVLYHATRLKKGRQDRKIYVLLKEQIDSGREEFRRRYLDSNASMSDYFHQELVHTLAKDDATILGSEYPGPIR